MEFRSGFRLWPRRLLLPLPAEELSWLDANASCCWLYELLLYLFLMALVRVVTFLDFMTALVSSQMTRSMSSRFLCISDTPCSGELDVGVTAVI